MKKMVCTLGFLIVALVYAGYRLYEVTQDIAEYKALSVAVQHPSSRGYLKQQILNAHLWQWLSSAVVILIPSELYRRVIHRSGPHELSFFLLGITFYGFIGLGMFQTLSHLIFALLALVMLVGWRSSRFPFVVWV